MKIEHEKQMCTKIAPFARALALAWSSPILGRLCSSAYSAAAASSPAWRIPPPMALRMWRARVANSALPTSTAPIGAPRPLLRQIVTESQLWQL